MSTKKILKNPETWLKHMDQRLEKKIRKEFSKSALSVGQFAKSMERQFSISRDEIKAVLERPRNPFPWGVLAVPAVVAGLAIGGYTLTKGPEPKPVVPIESASNTDYIPGTQSVSFSGVEPQVYVVPQLHPREQDLGRAKEPITARPIEEICLHLYDTQSARAIVFEGMTEETISAYNRDKHIVFPEENDQFLASCARILNAREWTMYGAENLDLHVQAKKLENKVLLPLRQEFVANVNARMRDIIESFGYHESVDPQSLSAEQRKEMGMLMAAHVREHMTITQGKIRDVLYANDMAVLKKFYDLVVTQREEGVLRSCEEALANGDGPIVVIFGAAHAMSLKSKLNKDHALLEPLGLPRGVMYHPSIDVFAMKYLNFPEAARFAR